MHDAVADHIVVLAMIQNCQIEHAGVFHGAAHEFVILDAVTVIGNSNDTGLNHRSDRGHFLAGQISSYRAGGINIHAGSSASPIDNPSHAAWAVGWWARIRHAYHRGKTTGGRGLAPGSQGFFVGLARLAKVDM